MSETLQRTPLYAAHVAAGGQMVPFAGWEMPVQYAGRGVVAEHMATRTTAGLFDVSHMGEIIVEGPGATATLNGLVTNDVSKLEEGTACYALLCHANGGTVDDLFVYRLGPERYLVCVNASNKDKDYAYMKAHASKPELLHDRSDDFAQIALQGPNAAEILARVLPGEALGLPRNRIRVHSFHGADMLVATTGYTGEPGFEIYCPPELAMDLWNALMTGGADLGISPVGLGARDTLRLEMGYALYGHELDDETNGYEAKVGWAIKLDKAGGFIGRDALAGIKTAGVKRKLVGLKMVDRGIAREGTPIVENGQRVGHVTSGTHSPNLKQAIAMAYVPSASAALGQIVTVELRGEPRKAQVVSYPFVQTALTGN
jgi:aminomethyltransferase